MPAHDWGRLFMAGQLIDGPCIWCGLPAGTEGECANHPRRRGARPTPPSVVDDFIGERLAEIRKAEGRA